MSSVAPALHEIAWIQGGRRVQCHLALPEEALPVLGQLFGKTRNLDEIQGITFMQLPPPGHGIASTLADNILDACGQDIEDWPSISTAAEQLDALVETSPSSARPWAVEFVWNNGGGDDNLFTQHFTSVPNTDQAAAFIAALSELQEGGVLYDFIDFDPAQPRQDLMSLDELWILAQQANPDSGLLEALDAARSLEARGRLIEVASVSPAPCKSRPHKM